MTCIICFEKINNGLGLKCGHNYCSECILTWLTTKKNCPCCRGYVGEDLENYVTNRITRTTNIRFKIHRAIMNYKRKVYYTNNDKLEIFQLVLSKENRILLKTDKRFRDNYNEAVKRVINKCIFKGEDDWAERFKEYLYTNEV